MFEPVIYKDIEDANNHFCEMVNQYGFLQKFGTVTDKDEAQYLDALLANISFVRTRLRNLNL